MPLLGNSGIVKVCKKCGGTDFYANGLCRACKAEKDRRYRAKHRDDLRQKKKAYYEKNKLYWCARAVLRYKDNREKSMAQASAWAKNNPEKRASINRAYRDRNYEKARERERNYYLENKNNWTEQARNRRARKKGAGGKLSKGLAIKLFKLQRGQCACGCGQSLRNDYHMDHIMPLALGGANTDDNMQLLTSRCNQEKHAKHPIDFMQSRGFLL